MAVWLHALYKELDVVSSIHNRFEVCTQLDRSGKGRSWLSFFYTHKKKVARRPTSDFWMIGLFDSTQYFRSILHGHRVRVRLVGQFCPMTLRNPSISHFSYLLYVRSVSAKFGRVAPSRSREKVPANRAAMAYHRVNNLALVVTIPSRFNDLNPRASPFSDECCTLRCLLSEVLMRRASFSRRFFNSSADVMRITRRWPSLQT